MNRKHPRTELNRWLKKDLVKLHAIRTLARQYRNMQLNYTNISAQQTLRMTTNNLFHQGYSQNRQSKIFNVYNALDNKIMSMQPLKYNELQKYYSLFNANELRAMV